MTNNKSFKRTGFLLILFLFLITGTAVKGSQTMVIGEKDTTIILFNSLNEVSQPAFDSYSKLNHTATCNSYEINNVRSATEKSIVNNDCFYERRLLTVNKKHVDVPQIILT